MIPYARMPKFHSIMESFKLGFDILCIMLAGIYSLQQLFTYIKNEDYSDISFRKFADDASSKFYPTYTICFEDQSQDHIYKTEPIYSGAFNDRPHTSRTCPCGCHVQKELNRLFLVNNTCQDHDDDPDGSYFGPKDEELIDALYEEYGYSWIWYYDTDFDAKESNFTSNHDAVLPYGSNLSTNDNSFLFVSKRMGE